MSSNLVAERIVRRERRTRGRLRCEWCNRLFQVDPILWATLMKDKYGRWYPPDVVLDIKDRYVYVCDRARCLTSRPENWRER